MRLVYCIPSLYHTAGMERVLCQKVNWLSEHTDWEITILTTERVPQGQKKSHFPLHERVEIVEFNIDFNADYRLPLPIKFVHHIQKQRQYKRLFTAWVCNHKPDVCISLCGKEIEWLSHINLPCKKVAELHFAIDFREQWIRQSHDTLFWRLVGRLLTHRLIAHVRGLDRLVVLTQADREAWLRQGIQHVQVIANPCSIQPKKAGSHHLKQLLGVGRLEPQKGFDLLIQAWEQIANNCPDWTLRICGEGEMRGRLMQQIDQLGLTGRVMLEGLSEDIEKDYLQSQLFVLSSRYEGLPLALMEAMQCGLCCIATDCPQGPGELIENKRTGILVPPGDIDSLAQAIYNCIQNEQQAKEMGQAAYQYAKEHFSIATIMPKWMELLQ